MKRHTVIIEPAAQDDLERLHDFLLDTELDVADKAIERILQSFALLEISPHSCRKAGTHQGITLRELIINFGRSGNLALFEVRADDVVAVLAVRHQRESDYR